MRPDRSVRESATNNQRDSELDDDSAMVATLAIKSPSFFSELFDVDGLSSLYSSAFFFWQSFSK